MTPLDMLDIQIAMHVFFFPSLFFNAIIKVRDVRSFCLKKKKAPQEYPQPMDVFFQFSFEVTLRLQISTKGGRGGGGREECSNSDYHTILVLFCSFEKYLKFENSLFLKLQDVTSVQAAPGSVSMSQYTVNPFPAAS